MIIAKRIIEHASCLVVHDEVDVPLPISGVDVGEAVPLVGERAQRLREQRARAHRHGELALPRLHHGAGDADPVAEVEVVDRGETVVADRRLRDEELHRPGAVAQRREDELSLPAEEQDPAGHPHLHGGLGAGLDVAVRGVEARPLWRRDRSARDTGSPPRVAHRRDLGEARGALLGRQPVEMCVAHRFLSKMIRRPYSVSHGSWCCIVRLCGMISSAKPARGDHRALAELGLEPVDERVDLAAEAVDSA